MTSKPMSFTSIEPLEARIAPASVLYPTIQDAENDPTGSHFKSTTVGTPILLKAGDVLTTGAGPRSGSYLMFVEKGQCLVFTTDLNYNNTVDFDEITGIAAGDGLRLTSFVSIHGDIVTNLRANTTLTDTNNKDIDDDPGLKGDGRVLLNSRIEKIELRSLRASDLTDQNGDGVVDNTDIGQRLVLSTYSVYGQILAGGGFGVKGDATSGLIIDDTGRVLQNTLFTSLPGSPFGPDYYSEQVTPLKASVGGILVGSAASGEYFSFGFTPGTANDPNGTGGAGGRALISNGNDVQGTLNRFIPTAGTPGGGIFNVQGTTSTVTFNIGRLIAGDGGPRAAGGNIENVTLNTDDAGGYIIKAGRGGDGSTGGAGGSILNFQDLGSNTSDIVITGGTGGTGSTGAGGTGGVVNFGTMNLIGSVSIQEGSGGNGFTSGGNGAGLAKAVITSPDRIEDFARNIVGTTHDSPHDPVTGLRIIANPLAPGIIGQGNPVDFDGDGIGDIVFTSSDPSQLVVQFGDGFGGFRFNPQTGRPDRLYLDAPLNAEALTIGDFNGDGHYDIAAASSNPGDQGGIRVYISQYEHNGPGALTKSEDLNSNGINDLVGFSAPRYSVLPSIFGPFNRPLSRGGHAISDLKAGDFNGDGITDLAVVATYYNNSVPLAPNQFLLYMFSDVEDGKPTGQYYIGGYEQISPNADTTATIQATALNTGATHDVVIALADTSVINRSLRVFDFFSSGPKLIPLGQVDTNRDLPSAGSLNITLAPAEGHDFAIIDFNHDNKADFSVITESPAGFLLTLKGDGFGGGQRIDIAATGTQNAGFFFGPPTNNNGGANLTTDLHKIVGTDANGDGFRDEVAILYDTGGTIAAHVIEMRIGYPPVATPQPPQFTPTVGIAGNPGAAVFANYLIPGEVTNTTIDAFDAYYPNANFNGTVNTSRINYAVGQQETGERNGYEGINFIYGVGDAGLHSVLNAEKTFNIAAGNGGTGLIGRGGDGGSLGGGSIDPGTFTGSLDVRPDFGFFTFLAGTGGNGFSVGGKGGSVQGVFFRHQGSGPNLDSDINAQLFAGSGGLSVSSTGGAGGSLSGNSIQFGYVFVAGSGGAGITGGSGGSIIGNGVPGLYDGAELLLALRGGVGGDGIKRGGDGGSISNFHASFDLNSRNEGGLIDYRGGDGGSAVSGAGGRGGSVLNCTPISQDRNQLAGDIYFSGGRGGDGRTGGNGGSVDTFINSTDQFQVPKILAFLGGDGGNGTKGSAGNGGSVTNIFTASTGEFTGSITNFTFSRFVAGRGGNSAGGNGGKGGNVSKINVVAQDNELALVGGAGGDGLFLGGSGGSVSNSIVQTGNTPSAKTLIVAGEGGNANAYLTNTNDPAALQTASKAFGGRIGHGGNGGSISNFQQLGGILCRTDLIAGNGGDTVNFGTVVDLSIFVGKGGSISNIHTDGSIGNLDALVPIKSYNDLSVNQTMDDFVQANLRNVAGSIADSVGNVGLVTGAAGRIKAVFSGYDSTNTPSFPSTPAFKGINGSLTSITARNIMSAVAGNVERIAAIQSVKDVHLTGAGTIGADKDPTDPNNFRRFLDRDGNPTPAPVLDGKLIDGAMVTRARPTDLTGHILSNLGPDVYVLA